MFYLEKVSLSAITFLIYEFSKSIKGDWIEPRSGVPTKEAEEGVTYWPLGATNYWETGCCGADYKAASTSALSTLPPGPDPWIFETSIP